MHWPYSSSATAKRIGRRTSCLRHPSNQPVATSNAMMSDACRLCAEPPSPLRARLPPRVGRLLQLRSLQLITPAVGQTALYC